MDGEDVRLQRGANVGILARGQSALDLAKDSKLQELLRNAGAKKGVELK